MHYTRCALCPSINKCIGPDGPSDADVLFIGEAPGFQEDKKERVFIGKTGDEVNRHYLPLAGLRRDAVGFTNAIRCLPISAGGKLDASRTKDQQLLASCTEAHLYPLLKARRLKVIVPLGAFACRAVCPEIDLEIHHGIPLRNKWGNIFPMMHPSRGIHEPKKMLHIRTDWQRLGWYLRGKLHVAVDEYPEPDYAEVTDEDEIQTLHPGYPLGADTEATRGGHPYCLTYSQDAGTGRLIRADNFYLLRAFQKRLRDWHAPILFHNWFYDWQTTEAMGLSFPHQHLVDTMSLAFHLGNLPQGAKALAFREVGMEMQDFDDLVTPYSTQEVLRYYRRAQGFKWEKPPGELKIDSKTGLWKPYQPQSMSTKFKRFFTDYSKNEDKDVFGMFEKNWADRQVDIEERCGPYPGKCISHVPFEEALFYACRDADALIRLRPILMRMRANVRHKSQEHWRG